VARRNRSGFGEFQHVRPGDHDAEALFRFGAITRQLEVQTGDRITKFVTSSIGKAIGAGIDKAVLVGSGSLGEPLGVANAANVNEVTFSGAATLAKVQSFQELIALTDADDDALVWIGHPSVRTKWRGIQKWSGASVSLWDCYRDSILARSALISTSLSATTGIVCGDFRPNHGGVFWLR
jgi:hypothetical protein